MASMATEHEGPSKAQDTSTAGSGGVPVHTTTASQYEHLLNEVESSEGQLGAVLRSVYDNENLNVFQEGLESRIKLHEKEIERMCNKNYQGFIESVSELLKVQSEAKKLRSSALEANTIIQDTGRELMKSTEQLLQFRCVQKNIIATIETLGLCTPVLELYCKLKEEMEGKQYYSALKTLEQLEHTFLPPVKGFIFSELLTDEIPKLRADIQKKSWAELTDFLASVRENSVHIGEVAMQQVQRHSSLQLAQDVYKLLNTSGEADPDMCAQDLVDFSPVYRCLHIYSVLGKREHFTEDYRNQRKSQVRLAIKPHGTWKGDIDDYKRYFFGIVGFFVVEDTILHTCQSLTHGKSGKGGDLDEGLVTNKIVHEFWQMALAEMLAVLRTTCTSSKDYHLVLKVKQLVVWFCYTLKGYGFEVEKLFEVLLEIREHYDELLMKGWGDSFWEIFDNDDYTPVQVETDEQYYGMLEVFPFQGNSLATSPYPRCFPFSGMVPLLYQQLKLFVDHSANYAEKLDLSHTDIYECVRKSVNILMSRTLSSCLSRLIQKERMGSAQLVQMWKNMLNLEEACGELEKHIAKVTKNDSEGVETVRLYGVSAFKDARQAVEAQIVIRLTNKISEVLEGADYDWAPKESLKKNSSYLEDCLQFTQATFMTLQPLPSDLVSKICSEAILKLVRALEGILLSDRILRINMNGVHSFEVDLKRCESFIRSNSGFVPSIENTDTHQIMTRLRQLVDLFLASDWTIYITEYTTLPVQARKYNTVQPVQVHTLLTKVRRASKKKKRMNLHVSNPFKKKDERKIVLKSLAELANLETRGDDSSEEESEAGGGGGGGGGPSPVSPSPVASGSASRLSIKTPASSGSPSGRSSRGFSLRTKADRSK